ncbi:MAG: type VI secretion system tube protein Hcp [Leadbetterella sp.]
MKNILYKIVILLIIAQSTSAQRVFLKAINGGTELDAETLVSGYNGSGNPNYGKHMEVWGVTCITTHEKFIPSISGKYTTYPTAHATFGVLTFTKSKSKSSSIFNAKITGGAYFTRVEVAFAKQINGGSYQTYLKYELVDVFVVSIHDNNDFTETIQLVAKKVKMDFKPTNPVTGTLGASIIYGWDFQRKEAF